MEIQKEWEERILSYPTQAMRLRKPKLINKTKNGMTICEEVRKLSNSEETEGVTIKKRTG